MDSVLPVLLGYGLGSLPLGYLVASRAKGIDLRRVGSGKAALPKPNTPPSEPMR